MIVSKAHDFGFIHIPKCAGSTVREQLRDIDDLGGRFFGTSEVEGLGRINTNHVPLPLLAEFFPDDLEALKAVTSYAIAREPMDRFMSGVAQFLRGRVKEPGEMSKGEILDETRKIIDSITADPKQRVAANTIFYRQADYVTLDGQQVITHVYAMDDMGSFFANLETAHQLTLKRDQVWNPTVTYKVPAMSGVLKRMKTWAKRALPQQAYVAARDMGIKALTTKGVPKINETLLGDAEIAGFVTTHYAQDAALYAQAQKRAAATA